MCVAWTVLTQKDTSSLRFLLIVSVERKPVLSLEVP